MFLRGSPLRDPGALNGRSLTEQPDPRALKERETRDSDHTLQFQTGASLPG